MDWRKKKDKFTDSEWLHAAEDASTRKQGRCKDCAAWAAAPINAATLWPQESVKVVKGEEHIGTFNKTEHSYRKFCRKCGGHLMADHPGMGLVDVYAVVLRDFPFEPMFHVHYENKTVSVKDGLPKFKDAPEALGGSGEMLPD